MDFFDLIEKAAAQGADTLSAPTFPFDPPGGGGTPVPDPGTTEGKNITLKVDTTSVKVQQRFRLQVRVDSSETEITGFTINISFDPEYFQVIDDDSSKTGVQVGYIDSTFIDTVNTANNTSGIITIKGEVSEDDATAIARTVAEIDVIPLKTGKSEITIANANTTMLSTSGVDILDNTNSLNLSISEAASQTISIGDGTTTAGDSITYIPKAGISNQSTLIITSLTAIILIAAGIYITRITRSQKHN